MHMLGLTGMPRRVYTYPAEMGWGTLNLRRDDRRVRDRASSVLLFVVNVVRALRRGEPAGANPWGAPSLEWATASPPPPYNFDRDAACGQQPHPLVVRYADGCRVLAACAATRREVLLTIARPTRRRTIRWALPDPGIWPLLSAMA